MFSNDPLADMAASTTIENALTSGTISASKLTDASGTILLGFAGVFSSDWLEAAANFDQVVRPPRHSWTMRKDGKHTAERHRRAVQLWRARHYMRQIPKDWPPQLRAAARLLVLRRCITLGKKQLARVVWPWTPRPASITANPLVRVPRGRNRAIDC